MIKKILLILGGVLLVLAAVGGWWWYVSRTSNPWNAKSVGEIAVPMGFKRVEAAAGSYEAYLRGLPLKERGAKVHYYTGGEVFSQGLSTAVIDMKLLSNYEQCADVTMRIRAEYLWKKGRYSEICFQDVNNKPMRYNGGGSRQAFEQYMRQVFGRCSTFSLYRETKPRALKAVQPGDVLVFPAKKGKLGHALLVVDVARNGKGKVALMLVEGNTPAREAHILRNVNVIDNPWFIFDEDESSIMLTCIYAPVYRFGEEGLRHY